MVLPTSGPISINQVAGEFGGSTPHNLTEYYRDTAYHRFTNSDPLDPSQVTINPNDALVPHQLTTLGSREVTTITIPEGSSSTGTERQEEFFINPQGNTGNAPGDDSLVLSSATMGTASSPFAGSGTDYTANDTTPPMESTDINVNGTSSSLVQSGVDGRNGSIQTNTNNAGQTRTATWNTSTPSTRTANNNYSSGTGLIGGDRDATLGGRYSIANPTNNISTMTFLSPVINNASGTWSGTIRAELFRRFSNTNRNFFWHVSLVPGNTQLSDISISGAGGFFVTGSVTPPSGSTILENGTTSGDNVSQSGNILAYQRTFSGAVPAGGSFRVLFHGSIHDGAGNQVGTVTWSGTPQIPFAITNSSYTENFNQINGPFSETALGGLPSSSNPTGVNAGRTPTSYTLPSNAVNIQGTGIAGETVTGGDTFFGTPVIRNLIGGVNGETGSSFTLQTDSTNQVHFFVNGSATNGVSINGRTATAESSTVASATRGNQVVAVVQNSSGFPLTDVNITINNIIINGSIAYSIDSGSAIAGNNISTTLNLGSFNIAQSKTITANLAIDQVSDSSVVLSGISSITGNRTVTTYQYTATNSAATSVNFVFNPDDLDAMSYTVPGDSSLVLNGLSRFDNQTNMVESIVFPNTLASQFTLTIDGISETYQLGEDLEGNALRVAVRDAIINGMFASQFSSVTILNNRVEITFENTENPSVSVSFTNNNGNLETDSTSGEIVQGGSAATPSQITIDFDSADHTPDSITLILGRQDTEDDIAEVIAESINAHVDFTATSSENIVTVTDNTRRAQDDITITVDTAGTSNLAIPTSAISVIVPGVDDNTRLVNQDVPSTGTINLTDFHGGRNT